jgi:3-hydroxymyristoyl/3-hydroxydecanoyl-(acyl carrier protein) dehydratase
VSEAKPGLPRTPCRFDEAFLAELLYDPEVLLLDELLEVDPERSLVRASLHVAADLPLTAHQRVDPERHPRHLAGGLIVHATGSLGFVHAYYLLHLRTSEGWTGYGTHIHRAVFRGLIEPGDRVEATCRATRLRLGGERHVVRYAFDFRRDGKRVYEGDQTAMWFRVA